MTDRVLTLSTLAWGIPGILVIAVLVLLGADLYRASRTGPIPKRRLIAAAILLLVSAGMAFGVAEEIGRWGPASRTMCYFGGALDAGPGDPTQRITRLSRRTSLLIRLAGDGKVGRESLRRLTPSIESELLAARRVLSSRPMGIGKRSRMEETCQEVQDALAKLNSTLRDAT